MDLAKKLESMSVEQLLELREAIDTGLREKLSKEKADLQSKLALLERYAGTSSAKRGVAKGTKVKPKYRGPDGETWAGRGARPKWLSALLKKGHKPDEFLIA